jgi:hypothetical protein
MHIVSLVNKSLATTTTVGILSVYYGMTMVVIVVSKSLRLEILYPVPFTALTSVLVSILSIVLVTMYGMGEFVMFLFNFRPHVI